MENWWTGPFHSGTSIGGCHGTAALRTELGLNVSGGGKTNQYYFSAGYLNDKGIALESGYERFNLRSNVTSQMTKWLRGGVNMSFAHSLQNYPVSSDTKTSNVINAGRLMNGFYPIYQMNEDGTYKLVPRDSRYTISVLTVRPVRG